MNIFAIGDPVWNALIAAVVAVFLAWLDYKKGKKLDKIVQTGEKAAETGEKTHTLVNSNMGVQLKLNAYNSQIVAELRKNPEDIEAATLAKKMLLDHERKQTKVDSGNIKEQRL